MVRRQVVGQRGWPAVSLRVLRLSATLFCGLALSQPVAAQGAETSAPSSVPDAQAPATGLELELEPASGTAPAAAAPAAEQVQRHSLLTAIEVAPGATCLAADKLIRRVERWLNQTKVDARIRVHVLGDESDPYKVQFSIDRGDGQPPAVRRIDDAPADCEQLHSALALSIALAIDASILGAGTELPDDETLLREEEGGPAAEEPRYLRVALGVLGQLSTGLLTSDLALGAAGRLEVGFVPWLDLRLGILFASVGDQRIEAVPGTFEAAIVAGRADVCGAYSPAEVLRLLACASGVAGQIRTEGHGYMDASAQASAWTAAGGGLEAQAQMLDQLEFAVSVELLIPFARRTVLVRDLVGLTVAERELTGVGIVIGVGAVFRVF